jgi:hypothetical protein
MHKRILIPLLLLLSLLSCNSKRNSGNEQRKAEKVKEQIDTSISKDFVRALNFYKSISINANGWAKEVKFNPVGTHFDSLQICLWNIGGLYPSYELYTITKVNSIWKGLHYHMEPDSNYISGRGSNEFLKGPLPLKIRHAKSITPELGWTKFIDSLISLNIMTLPDMDDLPQMKIQGTDSPSIIIEVSRGRTYRFYRYFSLGQLADSFWQARKAAIIQSLFYTEFTK